MLIFCSTAFWTAFGAVGQWLCAIATFCAVLVALKPFKRSITVWLELLHVTMSEKETVVSFRVHVRNGGAKAITISEIGIKERIEVTLVEGTFLVEDGEQKSFGLKMEQIENSFLDGDIHNFSIFVRDNKGNSYYSKKYKKTLLKEEFDIAEYFK